MTTFPSGDTFVGLGHQPYDEQADLEGCPAYLNYGMRECRPSWRSLDHLSILRGLSPVQQSWSDAMNDAIRYHHSFDWWFPPKAET